MYASNDIEASVGPLAARLLESPDPSIGFLVWKTPGGSAPYSRPSDISELAHWVLCLRYLRVAKRPLQHSDDVSEELQTVCDMVEARPLVYCGLRGLYGEKKFRKRHIPRVEH